MAIKRRLEDISIVVSVETPWFETSGTSSYDKQWRIRAEKLKDEIKRHVDGWSGIAIETRHVSYCEFCGDTGNEPLWCCNKSQDEIATQEREEFGL